MANINPQGINTYKNIPQFQGVDGEKIKETASVNPGAETFMDLSPKSLLTGIGVGMVAGGGLGLANDYFISSKANVIEGPAGKVVNWINTNKYLSQASDFVRDNLNKIKNKEGSLLGDVLNKMEKGYRPKVYSNKLSQACANTSRQTISQHVAQDYLKNGKDVIFEQIKKIDTGIENAVLDAETKNLKLLNAEKAFKNMEYLIKEGKVNPKHVEKFVNNMASKYGGQEALQALEKKEIKIILNKLHLLKESEKNIFSKVITKFNLLVDKTLAIRLTGKGVLGKAGSVMAASIGAFFIGDALVKGAKAKKGDKISSIGENVAESLIGFFVLLDPSMRLIYHALGIKNIDPSKYTGAKKVFAKGLKCLGKVFGIGMDNAISRDAKLKELYEMKAKGIKETLNSQGVNEAIGKVIKARKGTIKEGMTFMQKLGMRWGGRAGFIARNLIIFTLIQPAISDGLKWGSHKILGTPKNKEGEKTPEEVKAADDAFNKFLPKQENQNPLVKKYLNRMQETGTNQGVKDAVYPTYTHIPSDEPVVVKTPQNNVVDDKVAKADKALENANQILNSL